MGAPVVVFVDEGVAVVLELFEVVGCGLGGEPLFECLLEPFDFPAGGGVVHSGVFLDDVEVDQGAFEAVASTSASGEPGGVDHAVIGQH